MKWAQGITPVANCQVQEAVSEYRLVEMMDQVQGVATVGNCLMRKVQEAISTQKLLKIIGREAMTAYGHILGVATVVICQLMKVQEAVPMHRQRKLIWEAATR